MVSHSVSYKSGVSTVASFTLDNRVEATPGYSAKWYKRLSSHAADNFRLSLQDVFKLSFTWHYYRLFGFKNMGA